MIGIIENNRKYQDIMRKDEEIKLKLEEQKKKKEKEMVIFPKPQKPIRLTPTLEKKNQKE
jgi:hypothetical protein